jgi:two-component system, cell cycle sensor histidine kinase and response regulator CckA
MLQQELPLLDSRPVDGASRWLVPAIAVAAAATGSGLLWIAGAGTGALLFLAACAVAFPAVILMRRRQHSAAPDLQQIVAAPDYSLVGAMLGLADDAAALTDSDGTLLAANAAYRERFDAKPPDKLPADGESALSLDAARTMAWRDGGGCARGIETGSGEFALDVERVGARGDLLLWRFLKPVQSDPISIASNRLRKRTGELLAGAGVLAALVDRKGIFFRGTRCSGRGPYEVMRAVSLRGSLNL